MYIEQLKQELDNATNMYSTLHEQLHERNAIINESDREIFDLEHLLENRKHYKLTAPILTKISIEISDIRIQRRTAKDDKIELEMLLKHYHSLIDKTKLQISELEKENKRQSNPTYIPRSKIYKKLGITMKTIVINKD